jgi:hypothetical protein
MQDKDGMTRKTQCYGVFIEIVVTSISCILHQPTQYGLVDRRCKGKLSEAILKLGFSKSDYRQSLGGFLTPGYCFSPMAGPWVVAGKFIYKSGASGIRGGGFAPDFKSDSSVNAG